MSLRETAVECAREWGVELDGRMVTTPQSLVAFARDTVVKVQVSHRESDQEADALERWRGEGAVQLLARDDERHALLIERCVPGTSLSQTAEDPLGVLIDLLPRLWVGAGGFRTLAEEVVWWDLGGELGELAHELAATQGELVLVHQDLHGDNVLAARREPWLVIDPKPLAAEREFAIAPIVRSGELGHSRREALGRLDRLCAELGLDRDRARGWTIVQTVAWSGDASHPEHGDVVGWLR
jgi:streptomycin 6-kinase